MPGENDTIGALMRGQGLDVPEGLKDHPVVEKYFLLTIGIDTYAEVEEGTAWPSLNNAVYDASRMMELLLDRYRFERPDERELLFEKNGHKVFRYQTLQCCSFYNEEVTRNKIFSHINRVKAVIGENDAFLIYFSGHGVWKNRLTYSVPYGGNLEDDFNWVNWSEIIARFNNFEAEKKCRDLLLILDCCYGGAISQGLVNANDGIYSRYVLTAASSRDASSDGPHGSGGPFANKMLEILEKNTHPYISIEQLNTVNALNAHFGINGLDQQAQFEPLPGVNNGRGQFVFELAEQDIPPVSLLGRSILDYLDFELQRGILPTHFKSRYRPINLITTFGHPTNAHKLLGKVLFRWLFDPKISGRIPLSDAGLQYLEVNLTKLGSEEAWDCLIRMLALPEQLRDFDQEKCVNWILDQVREGAQARQARHLVLHFRFEVGSTQLFENLEKFYLDFQSRYLPLFRELKKEEKMNIGRVFVLFSDERAEAGFTPFTPGQQAALLEKYGSANLNLIAPEKIGKINQNHIFSWIDNTKVLIQTNSIQKLQPEHFFDPFDDDVAFEIDEFIDLIIAHCGVSAEVLMGFLFDFENKAVYDK